MPKEKSSLFREEAVSHRAPTIFGGVMVYSGKTPAILAFIAFLLMLGLVAVLIFGTYDRKERVAGFIAPTTGLVRIVPPRSGVISSLEITDGQQVAAGQRLFSISSLRSIVGGVNADAAQVAALELERASVQSQIERESEVAKVLSQDTARRIESLKYQAELAQSQKALAEQRAEMSNREVTRLESLEADAHVAASLLDARRGEVLNALQDVAVFNREIERLQSEVSALDAEKVLIPLRLSARHDELGARILEIDRMLAEAEVQREIVVPAPVSGRITSLVAFPGQSVTPNQAMLAILPEDGRMQAVLLVPSHAAGFIRTGQEVRLRYDAYPHQRFGVHGGVVKSVSRTMLNAEDQTGPVRLQFPVYRVIVDLDSQIVTAYGESIPLQPDLTLQADVIRERMRIIEWIFGPLRGAVNQL